MNEETTKQTESNETLKKKVTTASPEELYDFVDNLPNLADGKHIKTVKRAILMRADQLTGTEEAGPHFRKDIEAAITEALKETRKEKFNAPVCINETEFDFPIKLRTHYVTGMSGVVGVTSTPVFISAMARNITTGKTMVKIQLYSQGMWQGRYISYSDIATPKKLLPLSDYGIEVNDQNAKSLLEYFHDMIQCNTDRYNSDLLQTVTDQLGWTPNGFAGYCPDIVLNEEAENLDLLKSVYQKGDLKAWVRALLPDMENIRIRNADGTETEIASKLRVLCDIAIASILIAKLGLNCFIGHIYGKSGTGKTIALGVAASIFGDPRPGKLLRTINGTINSLCSLCASLGSLPLVADEFETIRTNKGYDKAIMTLTEGIERSRKHWNGKNMLQRTWNSTIVTSGESNIVNSSSMLGVHNRVLSIDSSGGRPVIQNFSRVADAIEENYGLVGPMAVEFVEQNLDELKSICNDFRVDIAKGYECTGKVSAMLAAILTADYIFCNIALNSEAVFPDDDGLQPLEIEHLASYVITEREAAQWVTAKEAVADYVLLHQNLFKSDTDNKSVLKDKCIGSYDNSTGRIVIVKSVLEAVLDGKKIKFDDVKRDLAANGVLEKTANGRYQGYSSVGSCQGQFVTLSIPELVPDAV